MFDTRTELTEKIDLGEDSTIEFKRELPRRADMADEIAAFANARGGVILIGVDDDGTIVGLDRQELDATEETVVQICRDTSGWASFFVRTEPLRLRRIEKS